MAVYVEVRYLEFPVSVGVFQEFLKIGFQTFVFRLHLMFNRGPEIVFLDQVPGDFDLDPIKGFADVVDQRDVSVLEVRVVIRNGPVPQKKIVLRDFVGQRVYPEVGVVE